MQIVPFKPKALAARQASATANNNALMQGVSAGGFPVVSIKGKVFHIVRADERVLVTKPGEDDPASSIEVIIVAANVNLSRVYYAKGFEEGNAAKPDCYSNDGKAPAADSQMPQAKSCATCVHAQYGSKVSENGSKGWACANSRRIAIAMPDNIDDPMLLRIPGASLKPLAAYAKELAGHGYSFDEVVTRVGFDYTVAHPALTFKATGLVPEDYLGKVREVAAEDTTGQIIGTVDMPVRESVETFETPSSVAALPKKTPKLVAPVAAVDSEPDVVEEVLQKAEAKPVSKRVKTEPVIEVVPTADEEALDVLLDGTDFDD